MHPRTYLFVPADRPDRFAKALASGVDRVIIDLEDAVKPSEKATARQGLAGADLDWRRIVIRVNDIASAWWADDWAAVAALPVAAVMVPKAEDAMAMAVAAACVGQGTEIIPQIETARGLADVARILTAPGVERVALGHLDLAVDLGAAPTWEAMLCARSTLVLQSRLADRAAPIDSVTPELGDAQRLVSETAAARAIGFGAKLLIHPQQVEAVRGVFTPSEAEIDQARRVIDALEAAEAGGAVKLDGKMIDKPVADAARRVLAGLKETQE